jgi:hypothetical protein
MNMNMNQLALKNINTLLDVNDKSLFIFNNKEITINSDKTTEHINENNVSTEYALYFTFNYLLNHPRLDIQLVDIMNTSFNNLYENESFIKIIENDSNLEEIMDDISIRLDIITEKYNNRICDKISNNFHNYFNNQWNDLMGIVYKNMPHKFRNDSSDSDDDNQDKED